MVWQPAGTRPPVTETTTIIQIPHVNTFKSIWEYEESFLAGEIDSLEYLGSRCPICDRHGCHRQIKPYQRYAIDLFPFQKKRIPIARFECRQERATFSLLPVQLIPYLQYTVEAVIGTLLLALRSREKGQQGFYSASVEVDPDSAVTPWLIACWLVVVAGGFRRTHAVLGRRYDLTGVQTGQGTGGVWEEVAGYFFALTGGGSSGWPGPILAVVGRYSQETKLFVFGVPSQERRC